MIETILMNSVPKENMGEIAQEVQENLDQLRHNVVLETIKGWGPSLITFGFKVLLALVIFFIGSRMIKALRKMLDRSFVRIDVEISLRKFLIAVINAVMYCQIGRAHV